MFDGLIEGLGLFVRWEGLLLAAIAVAIGSAAAILPGVSAVTMMALLLPMIFGMDKYDALLFMAALMAAGGFAGSITSILLNVPGDGINAATTLDGYPMARSGRAGVAIGASATASGLGALIGIAVLALALPIVREFVLAFSPPEFFALAVAGIALVATVSAKSPIKGLTAGLLGMALGFIGLSIALGGTRFTFGVAALQDGIALIPAVIGLFALPELFELLRKNETVSQEGIVVEGGVWEGVKEVLRRPGLLIRSSMLGSAVGIVPGVGGSVASWVAYFSAEKASKSRHTFGKGNVEGVIAPEAAIDAKEGGSMLPVLAIGIPGSVSTAILLTAFQIKGVQPGQRLLQNEMDLVWVMIFAMVFSNLLTSGLGLLFANQLVKITLVPMMVLAPIVFVLGGIGSYADQQSVFGLILMLIMGILGWVMVRTGYPRPPLLVGLILMPIAEENFHISVQMSRGGYEFLTRPLTLVIFATIAIVFLLPPLLKRWTRRSRAAQEASVGDDAVNAQDDEEAPPDDDGSPLEALLLPVGLAAFALVLLVDTFNYRPEAQLFPFMVLTPLLVLLGYLALRAARRLRRGHQAAAQTDSPDQLPAAWVALWAVLLPLGMAVIGVVAGAAIFAGAFLLLFEMRRPTLRQAAGALALALAIGLSTHYIFGVLLGMRLSTGIL